MMKILVNASNSKKGGSLQVALSILNNIAEFDLSKVQVHLVISNEIFSQLDPTVIRNYYSHCIVNHSIYDLIFQSKSHKVLMKYYNLIEPDVVYTVFGPRYWFSRSYNISGFADGWCYNPLSPAWDKLSLTDYIKMKLQVLIKNWFIQNFNDELIIETSSAKKKLSSCISFDLSKISVIGNSASSLFQHSSKFIDRSKQNDRIRVLIMSAYYPHKNLEIIRKVDSTLPNDLNIEFLFTLPSINFGIINSHNSSRLKNLGVLKIEDVVKAYSNCDIVLLPTLLETFTAVYPEAMEAGRPIITSDMDFARDICGEAAFYVDPEDENEIASAILEIAKDKSLYSEFVAKGHIRRINFETPQSRALKILKLILKKKK